MITISRPYIQHGEKVSYLYSRIVDEKREKDTLVWYAVDRQYGEYLCDETADAFVLLMLQLAMQSGQDLKVVASVSARLLFNIENTLQPLFTIAFPDFHHIKIDVESESEQSFHGTAVGCGCSLGVDSFSSLLKHLSQEVPECYRVTHLALFNCGQLGDLDLKGAENNLFETLAQLEPFAKEVNLPLVWINSNLNELYVNSGVRLLQSSINRTFSCVLALQKLFGKYVYSSAYTVDDFHVSQKDESYMESALAPLMGTESMEAILSNPAMSRVEKTAYLSQYEVTYRYLNVCWSAQMKYGVDNKPNLFETKTKKNCGRCLKCLRTLLTLDILGRIDAYKDIFDLDEYYKRKDWFIYYVVRKRYENVYSKELVDLILTTNYPIPFKAKVLCYEGLGWKILRKARRCALKSRSVIYKIIGKN